MHKLSELDQRHVWHPFTQMRDWLRQEPIVIVEGDGAVLRDAHGKEYLDGNASIWTNLHGHRHPRIDAAIKRQLGKIAHSSALGLANEPASILAAELVRLANPRATRFEGYGGSVPLRGHGNGSSPKSRAHAPSLAQPLRKVFFSDDGSTALEVALKLAYESARRSGRSRRPKFLSLQGAYHGDTVGAVSLGHIDLFHKSYETLLFKSEKVMAPFCYRCPYNRAKPDRADAREYRQCNWECVDAVEQQFVRHRAKGNPLAALVVEPLIQGAAGMVPQPAGWLRQVSQIARADGARLIADEVMTGFGRAVSLAESGSSLVGQTFPAQGRQNPVSPRSDPAPNLFACHCEGVQPDFLAMAKGLTGGYLPMGATLTTEAVFDAFLGEYGEFKTFFHGHSYTGNQLGAAAALASLDLLQSPASLQARARLENTLRQEAATLWTLPQVGDIRQVGLILGIELVRRWQTREPFDLRQRAGIQVCEAMCRRGVLTRPVGNVLVLMPPYCAKPVQARQMVAALRESIDEVAPGLS